MLETKLTEVEIKQIKDLHQNIFETWELENDLLSLLSNWVEAFKQNLFYASISVFTVVLEKLLRDKLIMIEYKKDPIDKENWGYIEELERIEEMIEDSTDGNRYNFNNICKILVELWEIEESVSNKLIKIYKEIRIPIQHGIYGRLIKQQTNNSIAPITHLELDLNEWAKTIQEQMKIWVKKEANAAIGLHNPMVRVISLPPILKQKSFDILSVINELVKILK